MGTETWIISLPLSDSILYLKIIHPPNFREEPLFYKALFGALFIVSLESHAEFEFVLHVKGKQHILREGDRPRNL